MSFDDVEDGVESAARKAAGLVAALATGLYALLSGVLTLDPAFLVNGPWFTVTTLVSQYIGPQLLPGVPWSAVLFGAAILLVGAILYQYSNS